MSVVSVIEGKTKIVRVSGQNHKFVRITNKNDITAGNGARHDVIRGKGELCTTTTCNVFELLKRHGIPVAYRKRVRRDVYLAQNCTMIPVEVVVRGTAAGSYLKRFPDVKNGYAIEPPVVEFFYKTSGRKIGEMELPQDDPLLQYDSQGQGQLYSDKLPREQGYIGTLPLSTEDQRTLFFQLETGRTLALQAFVVLRKALASVHATLIDFKIECGVLPTGEIVIADSIDCDSWRVIWNGMQLSKEPYRNGMSPKETKELYQIAARLTEEMLQ